MCPSVQCPATPPGLGNMMSTGNLYFIITKKPEYPRHINAGCLCYKRQYDNSSYKRKGSPPTKLKVFPMGLLSPLSYDIDTSSMEELTGEKASLLLALGEDSERLKWYREGDALRTALTLSKGTEVTVEDGERTLKGIIRSIGNWTRPPSPESLHGTFFGIELQV